MALTTNFAVATDIVVLSIENRGLTVLLVRRAASPHKGDWALPGGFVLNNESLEAAARRELQEETGVAGLYLEQLYTFGDVGRDARGRVVSVAYLALMRAGAQHLSPGTDAADSKWFPITHVPNLAFDHAGILQLARERLASKIKYSNIALQLMPDVFTLAELQESYEILMGKEIDKRNFRKQIALQNLVIETSDKRLAGAHRPAQLFRAATKDVVYFN